MNEIQTFNFNDIVVNCYVVNDEPWFRAKYIAYILLLSNIHL